MMDTNGIIILVVGIIIGLRILSFALWVIMLILVGAIRLFIMASEQEILGLTAYMACWVLFFSVMAVICGIVGYLNRDDPWGLNLS